MTYKHGVLGLSCNMKNQNQNQKILPGKQFNENSVTHFSGRDSSLSKIICDKTDLVRSEPEWMKRGLQETASGYGAHLNSGYKINFNNRLYRIYVTIYSNSGSCWFKVKGKKIFVDAF